MLRPGSECFRSWVVIVAASTLSFSFALAIGSILIISGAAKLRAREATLSGVLEYEILPRRLARPFARVLPYLEMAVGLALVGNLWPAIAALCATSLLTSFAFAVAVNLVRGRVLRCHCFGHAADEQLDYITMLRLLVLIAGSAAVSAITWHLGTLPGFSVGDTIPMVTVAAGAAMIVYLLGVVRPLRDIWRSKATASATRNGGRVSLRAMPRTEHFSGAGIISLSVSERSVRRE